MSTGVQNGAFTMWMTGGGVKGGITCGETDEFAHNVAKDPVNVHDFQVTLLHLLGIDHECLTYKFQGRRFRLSGVHGKVVHGVLAREGTPHTSRASLHCGS